MATQQQHFDYMEKYLVYDIFKYFGNDATLIDHNIKCSSGLDGFMSAVYTVQLTMEIAGNERQELVLVKFMKGSPEFRESGKCYTQFANEVFVYAELLPAYENLLRDSKLNTELVEQFVPRVYCAKFGLIKDLGEARESVLALQHLQPKGFKLGPRLTLRLDQLEAMCSVLGPYHAMGYALRILQPQVEQRLRQQVVPLPFVFEANVPNIYAVLYRIAFDRFYEFYDRCRDQLLQPQEQRFAEAIERLRARYFEQPVELLERIRTAACDETQPESYFSTFLHGDFNRNNVLFHENEEGRVDGIRMIDFQELRYSTTAIDISFFLYMNTPAENRAEIFAKLLRSYHQQMHQTLELLLQRNHETLSEEQINKLLSDYSFARFEQHFSRYAFYGVMICMHFMPWLLGSEADCAQLSKLFETDMHGPAFYKLSMDIAGDEANRQIFGIVRHAFEQGYMDHI
ncbi:uncharacterized protein LOC6585454 [Drosophila mojavensis]|uniref:Uncharacterized protein, isoform A n=1 Tax=Drosophila mojavensis TaxID=7230 RepID=B4L6C8_DROMO|nr:uncharacterized protein LOC6585454 [Drosophila mojavensis]XP_043867593.1 uncharacterized protein LOC6585454 [Drosophila mojavensis]EDW05924.1 uncharacterized protein Dmoj_GI16200, isoform A [Drosophila mojavensis]KRG07088.1 uncharacterized protein Dmoj_GI16200, isoform B [Drosophila mojavensis]